MCTLNEICRPAPFPEAPGRPFLRNAYQLAEFEPRANYARPRDNRMDYRAAWAINEILRARNSRGAPSDVAIDRLSKSRSAPKVSFLPRGDLPCPVQENPEQ
ncbi:unnamed protein product [Lasius platythorax]|uniref:Uncharacterized protein n=1 Tax=Lasius platythorax TaxID=488582 RepID=A0AAV2MWB3_9HYME